MHSRMKRNAANAYSLTSVVQLEPYVNEVAEKLFTQLDREAKDPSNSVCLDYYFHAFALDAIFMLSFGKSLNMLEKGDERNIRACFEVIMPYMATVSPSFRFCRLFSNRTPYRSDRSHGCTSS